MSEQLGRTEVEKTAGETALGGEIEGAKVGIS